MRLPACTITVLFVFGSLLFAASGASAQTTWHVDDDACPAPGSGSQADPFCSIQTAIDIASDGDEIIVADGVYVGTADESHGALFSFKGKILTLRSVKGPESTIVDCQNAGRGFSFVNFETRDAILDGFTIKNGLAHNGGAIQCKDFSNPTIRNCIFIANVSEGTGRGGGLNMSQSAPFVTHCAFIGNIAEGSARGGGAIYGVTGLIPMHPSIHNSLFVGNSAYEGGGIRGFGPLDVRNCTFVGNTAADKGGGLYMGGSYSYVFSNCILWGDEAAMGSEVYLRDGTTSLTVKYSDVQGGQASVEGPGVLNWESGNIDVDPLFVDADQGDYHLLPGSPAIDAGDNTAVPSDVSDLDGDGDTSEPIPFDLDGRPRFLAELDTPDTGNPDGVHAIVDMGPYEIGQPGCPDLDDDGVVTICHAPPGNPDNTHTMTVSANTAAAHLAHGDTCGPCGPDGCAGSAPPDMPEGQTVWYVDDDDCPEPGGGSQADPFCRIQDGIGASDHGDVVLVAPGTYFENFLFMGKAITVQSWYPTDPDTVACTIIDGSQGEGEFVRVIAFAEGEENDSVLQGFTITHGSQGASGGGIICTSGSDPTIAHCVISNNSAQQGGGLSAYASSPTIRECTITENSAFLGGGVWAGPDSHPVITNCSISDNFAASRGGGVFTSGNSTVTDCVFQGNVAGWGGGIQSSSASSLTLTRCTFRQNTASDGSGGGVFSEGTDLVATNCVFEGNIAENAEGGAQQGGAPSSNNRPVWPDVTRQMAVVTFGYGGGLSVTYAHASVTNCLFVGNTGVRGGAVSCAFDASLDLADSTISGNHADATGGGVYVAGDVDVTVDNCVLWNDTAPEGPEILIYPGSGTLAVGYSTIEGGEEGIGGGDSVIWGDGNIDADPLFVDPFGSDYRLLSGSPCIDAGDNTAVPPDSGDLDGDGDTDEAVPVDLDGAPRFANDLDTPDTGNPDGIRPIVDMGAYELEGSECVDDDGDGQVTICHQPPGNSGNPQTMSVNQNNLPAHLGHGDSCGPCEEGDGDGESEASACPADVDGDGAGSAADLTELLTAWGACAGCTSDLDGDGLVGPTDLGGVLSAWGMCP